jgi:hypothetical protein
VLDFLLDLFNRRRKEPLGNRETTFPERAIFKRDITEPGLDGARLQLVTRIVALERAAGAVLGDAEER